MSESAQPGVFGRFLKGAMSGALSGALMVGVIFTVGSIFGIGAPSFFGMVACTSIFGGIMGVIKGGGEARSSNAELSTRDIATPVISQSLGRAQNVSMDRAGMLTTRADGKSWAETAGRNGSSRSAIDSILAKGNMTDSARADAILANREQAQAAESVR